MFLFLRLVLAHFIGDTILQPDEVYEIKKGSFLGVVLHSLIICACMIAFAYPYLDYAPIWVIILFAVFMHLAQDELKMRMVVVPKRNFIFFIGDQLLHLAFLLPLLLVDEARYPVAKAGFWWELYNNNSFILFCIGFVVVIFLGAYVWESYKASYFRQPALSDKNRIKYGMFERCIVLISFTFCAWWFLLIPVVFRLLHKKTGFTWSVVFNFISGGLAGWFLQGHLPIF